MTMMDEIHKGFRSAELQRRRARREALLRNLQNEGALLHEELSPEERRIHDQAIADIKQQQLNFEKELRPGYWQRLWAAVRGR